MPVDLLKGTLANNVDPDQTPHSAASDQGLHCLHQIYNSLLAMVILKDTHPFYWK